MSVFDRAFSQAKLQIETNGELVTWTSTGESIAFDPSKPWITTPGEPQTHKVSIIFLSASSTPFEKLITGSSLATSGKKGLMAAVSFMPKLADTVTRGDGTILALDSIDPLNPNGEIILWKLVFKA